MFPFVGWVAIIHLLLGVLLSNVLIRDYKLTRLEVVVIELVIDFFFAIFYFEGIFPVITNFIMPLFKN